ncbi:hypothetical protein AA12717_0321 [Gluconacetobacter sacchari DSM 12717]|uniref:Uncharacterized protein n=1 Tax=Gluconacetobacter sacchari DSM 12717 TaxID=1307940 RepID=A0ABQ0P5Q5_9PROT|nr:hypothetical protein AA12717_0321 [Gluconacetobacter sacchari DSM 12717]
MEVQMIHIQQPPISGTDTYWRDRREGEASERGMMAVPVAGSAGPKPRLTKRRRMGKGPCALLFGAGYAVCRGALSVTRGQARSVGKPICPYGLGMTAPR